MTSLGQGTGKQRFKRVQAGRLVREVLWTPAFPGDSAKTRAEKSRYSSEARRKINDRYSWQKLKALLAANFTDKDLVLTLTYDDAHLPESHKQARGKLKQFFAVLREHRRQNQQPDLKYIYCTENKHGDGRFHHHVVINAAGEDYAGLRRLWTYGQNLHFERVDIYGYEELAKYLTKEAREFGHPSVGARSWVASRGLRKPEVLPSEWVPGNVRLSPPAGAHIVCTEAFENSWGRFSYVEYLLPLPPKEVRTRPRKAK